MPLSCARHMATRCRTAGTCRDIPASFGREGEARGASGRRTGMARRTPHLCEWQRGRRRTADACDELPGSLGGDRLVRLKAAPARWFRTFVRVRLWLRRAERAALRVRAAAESFANSAPQARWSPAARP